MAIKSPYNFVPAPSGEEIFTPDWADQVSHDIPFSDGESGEIEVVITAETPIFIRNGHSRNQVENEFSHYIDSQGNRQYFIPATSVKGMLRNVLEIMSFGKLDRLYAEKRIGLRDMHNQDYSKTEIRGIKAGWLKKEGDNWKIFPVKYGRISYREIEVAFELNENEIEQLPSAFEKYNVLLNLADNPLILNNREGFTLDDEIKHVEQHYYFDRDSTKKGELVLYGSIDNKEYEFIFFRESERYLNVDKKLIDNLDELEKSKEDSLWNFFRSQKTQRIPVFFKQDEGKIKHFGLSKLYRLNNGYRIGDLKNVREKSTGKSLAETIFGTVNENNSLKGRVFISHARQTTKNNVSDPEVRVLASPKPDYYPTYIKQHGVNGKLTLGTSYNTYQNDESEISGYKRYPVHLNVKQNAPTENENIPSEFRPLPKGSVFECKIRFHNLRKAEIGALLSALTFHDSSDKYHSIGGAKPYGFGKVSLKINMNKNYFNYSISEYLKEFESIINSHFQKKCLSINWINSPQIKELFAIASNPNDDADNSLEYMTIERENVDTKDQNEFNNVKKNKVFLKPYSEINKEFK